MPRNRADMMQMYRIAKMYYMDGLTQAQIAEAESISRSQISRLLDQARSRGIVEITVRMPGRISLNELRDDLIRELKLKDVAIAPLNETATEEDKIEAIEGVRPKIGELDISFYRDDFARHISPVVHTTKIMFPIDDVDVVLVDDVLYTGRTVRSALDALMDLGRPKTVQLAVMVDRGHRELPIRADYVGKNVPSSHTEDVRVSVMPLDEKDCVEIWEKN